MWCSCYIYEQEKMLAFCILTFMSRKNCWHFNIYEQEKFHALLSQAWILFFFFITSGPGWLVGCFGFNGPLRQYFSLYRAVSQREGERGEKGQMREKMSKQPPPAPTASATGPCPTIIQISRTPQHWKFTQHLRTTRPPLRAWSCVVNSPLVLPYLGIL